MTSQKNTLTIVEWQEFSKDDIKNILIKDSKENTSEDKKDKAKENEKAQKIFEDLKIFASEEDNRPFIAITKGGKCLKARHYVGILQTKSGFCLEILPKIKDKKSKDPLSCEELKDRKTLLISMLKTLRNFPFKTSNISNLQTQKSSLLEIFIQMFLNELSMLIKKGIKSDYQPIEANRLYLKGKLLFSEHIRHNFAHQERFYTASDEYCADIPQNRLIASTLAMFSKLSLGAKTQALLRECRFVFEDIPPSKNIDRDFQASHQNRSLKHYEYIMAWCKVFLKKQSFTPYARNCLAIALLFDMNKLFESYVAHYLKTHGNHWHIRTQDNQRHLLCKDNKDNKDFYRLCPDIVATHKTTKKTIILDTKWKQVNSQKDIAQSDLYQMWAYASKYEAQKAILLYPKIGHFNGESSFKFKANESVSLKILFIDLLPKKKTTEEEAWGETIKELCP